MSYEFLGKKISGRFTIPSGIITTDINIIKKIISEIPEIGVITTKSIGPEPKTGNCEPIITQYAPGCFMNAVGLTNPGAKKFSEQLKELKVPSDKFLLTSIFGSTAAEFVEVAKLVAPYSDGLELNLSCPHAKGYGMAIGQKPELVKEFCAAVKEVVDIPIIAKLTPNTPDIGLIAKAAVEGGADGICAINTVGPGLHTVEGNPVLTNKLGGMSGKGILPIGIKCVKQIKDAIDIPVIACGGISNIYDVIAYKNAGANIFGVGSALAGLKSENLQSYFKALGSEFKEYSETNSVLSKSEEYLKKIDMSFEKYTLLENQKIADDFSVLVFDKNIDIKAGQFVFVWIPGLGEKPFSILDNEPLKLGIQGVGCFTKALIALKEGSHVYFRGPYGQPVILDNKKHTFTISGGCGFAANYLISKENKNVECFIGSKDKEHLFCVKEAQKYGKTNVSTDDGSYGFHGFVTQLMKERLEEIKKEDDKEMVFYNCGPKPMIKAATKIQLEFTKPENIFNSIDHITKCGVGLCGSCATKNGERSCIDGPFIQEKE
ncbi:tRNA-dihydrouridine synthase [archaeon]|nr:tRNA-dihydrouridine synthase [archaeon]MBL7057335.1 tRNA-dihydrouridine synthase [Candidatus Woesearchaeota archaeon]